VFLGNKNIDNYLKNCNFIKHSFKKQEFKKHFHNNYSIGLITKRYSYTNIGKSQSNSYL